jgi:hypothetical protein
MTDLERGAEVGFVARRPMTGGDTCYQLSFTGWISNESRDDVQVMATPKAVFTLDKVIQHISSITPSFTHHIMFPRGRSGSWMNYCAALDLLPT